MGCGCNQTPAPAGMGQRLQPTTTAPTPNNGGTSPTSGVPGILQTPPPQGQTQSFTLLDNNGRAATFGSRLEADAARVRLGGGRVVKG